MYHNIATWIYSSQNFKKGLLHVNGKLIYVHVHDGEYRIFQDEKKPNRLRILIYSEDRLTAHLRWIFKDTEMPSRSEMNAYMDHYRADFEDLVLKLPNKKFENRERLLSTDRNIVLTQGDSMDHIMTILTEKVDLKVTSRMLQSSQLLGLLNIPLPEHYSDYVSPATVIIDVDWK